MKGSVPITRSEPAGNANYSSAIGYLRAAIIVVVVAVHSVLAYCSFAPLQILFGTISGLWRAYPIVDGRRWAGFDPIVGLPTHSEWHSCFSCPGCSYGTVCSGKALPDSDAIGRHVWAYRSRLPLPFWHRPLTIRRIWPPLAVRVSRPSSDSGFRSANGRLDPHGSSGFCWRSIASLQDSSSRCRSAAPDPAAGILACSAARRGSSGRWRPFPESPMSQWCWPSVLHVGRRAGHSCSRRAGCRTTQSGSLPASIPALTGSIAV